MSYHIGVVDQTDPARMMARVRFPDRGDLLSWWLPVGVPFAQDNRAYRMPDVGEQVACLMDRRFEAGVIVCSIYGGAETPPESSQDVTAIHFADGAVISYDRAAHYLKALLPPGGKADLTADGGIHLVGPVTLDGDLTHNGDTHQTGQTVSSGDHVAGGISLMNHVHGEVQSGNSTTGGPQ